MQIKRIGSFNNIDGFSWSVGSDQTFDSYVDDIKVTPLDNFDSYTSAASLNSDSGGTGWSGNWSASSVTTDTAPSGGQGGLAAHISGAVASASRSFNPLSTGVVDFSIYSTTKNFNANHSYSLYESTSPRVTLRWSTTTQGVLEAYNGNTGLYDSVATGVSQRAWHNVKIKFGLLPNTYAVSVDGSAFSANKGTNGSFSQINKFQWDNSSTQNFDSYIDDLNTEFLISSTSPTENFDSYTAGAFLNRNNGGTGWSTGWSTPNVTVVVTDTAPAGGQGGLAAHMHNPTGIEYATRYFPSMATGTISFRIYSTLDAYNNTHSYSLYEGNNNPVIMRWSNNYPDPGTPGNLEAWNDDVDGYQTIATGVASSTWHTVQIKFGEAPNKYAVSVDGGAFSSDLTVKGGSFTNLDSFRWENSSDQTFDSYLDDLHF